MGTPNKKRHKNGSKVPAKIGRPTRYTDGMALDLCDRLEAGETLEGICRDKLMPGRSTVNRWKDENPTFRAAFARARLNQMHTWADQCVDIADDGTTDYITKVGRNGVEYEALDQEHVQRSKLRVDTRLRIMAVVAPHTYGPTVAVEHGGDVTVTHTISDRERMRRMALFLLEDQAAGALIEGEASPVADSPEVASNTAPNKE